MEAERGDDLKNFSVKKACWIFFFFSFCFRGNFGENLRSQICHVCVYHSTKTKQRGNEGRGWNGIFIILAKNLDKNFAWDLNLLSDFEVLVKQGITPGFKLKEYIK